MKKIALLMLCLSLLTMPALAKNGDVADTLYHSDILTKVHGLEIESFSIDGEMLIKAEALRDYGYTVTYDDTVRALFINKTGEIKEDFRPEVKRGTLGGIYGYTYETDIWVYLNGSYITSYSLDGEMAIKVEEMGKRHGLCYSYDDSQRLLVLEDAEVPSKEEQIKDCLTLGEELSFLSRGLVEQHSGDGFDIIVYWTGGMPRSQTDYEYFDDKGNHVILDGIFNRYGFHDGWGRTVVRDLKLCGNALKFTGESNQNRPELNFPEREYILDLCTHTIKPSPVGSFAEPLGFAIEVDGVAVPGYSIGGRPFLDSAVLEFFGFERDGVHFAKTKDTAVTEYTSPEMLYGKIQEPVEPVTVNGKEYETYLMDGMLLINADDLAIRERNITPNGFWGEWDNESSTLKIRTNNQ